MTKEDKIKNVDQARIERRKRRIREDLGIDDIRFLLMKNYCPEVDTEKKYTRELDPSIDEPILRFFVQICESSVENEDSCCLWAPQSELLLLRIKSVYESIRRGIGLSQNLKWVFTPLMVLVVFVWCMRYLPEAVVPLLIVVGLMYRAQGN